MVNKKPVTIEPSIEINPSTSMADERVQILLHGFNPGTAVTVRAETRDDSNLRWSSSITIQMDKNGYADLLTSKPLAGTYSEADPMGLFWSMRPAPDTVKPSPFTKTGVEPTTVTLYAEQNNTVLATATCRRLFISPDTEMKEVHDCGLAGKFFAPKNQGRCPGIIVLTGSGGGLFWSEQVAALLSSHGYAALALAYFNYDGLPPNLVDVPLEYFESAFEWMEDQDSVIRGKMALSGASRGGELVLLLGATFSKIRCVIAYVPSNVVFGSPMIDPGEQRPCWTYHNENIPFISRKKNPEKVDEIYLKEPIAATPIFLANYDFSSVKDVSEGAIPVENTNGAILMITGRDDQMWPSYMMADYVMDRLRRKGFSNTYQHLCYEGAGHFLQYPYLPSTVNQLTHPLDGLCYLGGGGNVKHHIAECDSWKKMLEFLENNYRGI
jgi:acetyl esterase/lipase